MRAEWVLLRFHARGSVRASWRLLTPILGAIAVGAGLNADPAQWLAMLAGIDRPWPAVAIWIGLAWLLASWTAQRLAPAAHGFMNHLPASRSEQRRAHGWALLVAQLPVYVVLSTAWVAAAISGHAVSPWSWLVLPIAAVVVAAVSLRTVQRLPISVPVRASWWPLLLVVNTRSAAWPSVPSALLALLPLVGAALFARHEPSGAPIVALAARLAGVMAVSIALAGSAEALALHRPWWSWSRSLPETPHYRVWIDALWLGSWAAPAALMTWVLFPRQAWAVCLAWPALSLVAAGAIRRLGLAASGTETLWMGGFVAAAIALVPAIAVLAVPGAWLAQRIAVARDRALRVSVWDERTTPVKDAA